MNYNIRKYFSGKSRDTENGAENNFNPFVERKIEDPTT